MKAPELTRSRREVLKGIGILTVAAASVVSRNAAVAAQEHSHHHHGHTVDLGLRRLIDHATDCINKGELCNQHCIELVKSGDTSIADCMDTVQEMLAACTALSKLAAYDSKHLRAMVNVCIGVCEDCESECRKHEAKHAECKACADSCADFLKVCKEYLA